MSIFFRVLSPAYIAGIFLLADSPMVSDLTNFNPYSLLHIPLYGILTLLLVLSFSSKQRKVVNSIDSINSKNPMNYLIAGIIALIVAIADEVHQDYIPNRNPSVIDVLLDAVGILLCTLVVIRIRNMSSISKRMESLRRMSE